MSHAARLYHVLGQFGVRSADQPHLALERGNVLLDVVRHLVLERLDALAALERLVDGPLPALGRGVQELEGLGRRGSVGKEGGEGRWRGATPQGGTRMGPSHLHVPHQLSLEGQAVGLEEGGRVAQGLEHGLRALDADAHVPNVAHDLHEALLVRGGDLRVEALVDVGHKLPERAQLGDNLLLQVLREHVDPLCDPSGQRLLDGLRVDAEEGDVGVVLHLSDLVLHATEVADAFVELVQVQHLQLDRLAVLALLRHLQHGPGQEVGKHGLQVGGPQVLVGAEAVAEVVAVGARVVGELHHAGQQHAHLWVLLWRTRLGWGFREGG